MNTPKTPTKEDIDAIRCKVREEVFNFEYTFWSTLFAYIDHLDQELVQYKKNLDDVLHKDIFDAKAFDLGYQHGERDSLVFTPISKNAGLWIPIGMMIGYGISIVEGLLK